MKPGIYLLAFLCLTQQDLCIYLYVFITNKSKHRFLRGFHQQIASFLTKANNWSDQLVFVCQTPKKAFEHITK
jgi:hypothetical protein